MNPKYEAWLKEKRLRLQEWYNSEEYKAKCVFLDAKAEKMRCIGLAFLENKEAQMNHIESSVVRTVIGSSSGLHRGVYCPSPVYDVVVGNVKRGKILKRLSSKSKTYYIYGFDDNDRLRYIKGFYNGILANTEYLLYEDSTIYGITMRLNKDLESITEETYNKFIESYHFSLFNRDEESIYCMHMHSEQYDYDKIGLCKATFGSYLPQEKMYMQRDYSFDRVNGYLSTYTAAEHLGNTDAVRYSDSPVYEVRIKRKAEFDVFAE